MGLVKMKYKKHFFYSTIVSNGITSEAAVSKINGS